jgi:hypothetical protein
MLHICIMMGILYTHNRILNQQLYSSSSDQIRARQCTVCGCRNNLWAVQLKTTKQPYCTLGTYLPAALYKNIFLNYTNINICPGMNRLMKHRYTNKKRHKIQNIYLKFDRWTETKQNSVFHPNGQAMQLCWACIEAITRCCQVDATYMESY